MNISIYLVFALLLIVCALLLLVVLMQRPKQEGLGAAFGSQMTDQAFGARTTDVLKKGTVLFGTLFLFLCLTLGILINRKYAAEKSDLGRVRPAAVQTERKQAVPEDLNAKLAPATSPAGALPAPDASAPGSEIQEPAPASATEAPAAAEPAPAVESADPAEQPAS